MKRFDQINVIPFIDIMLVLLAIVLTTASFIATGILNIDLPSSKARSTLSEALPTLELGINSDHRYLIGDRIASLDRLKATLSELDRETQIVLRVDKSVSFEHFVTLIDLLKQQQLNRLSIVTRQH